MATKRKSIGDKLRFEVFKRDSFKCQYCGKCAPDVILNVDHINPVSKGGDNDIMNLITSCEDCNSGKGDRSLSDDSVMAKQRAQLEELNVRREQLAQMLAWRDGLKDINETSIDAAANAWSEVAPSWKLNAKGRSDLGCLIRKHGLSAVLDAISTAQKYIDIVDGKATEDSVQVAFKKVGGIARMSSEPDWKRQLYYIRGIARNRFTYINEAECMRRMEQAYENGASLEEIKSVTLGAKKWSWWCDDMDELIRK